MLSSKILRFNRLNSLITQLSKLHINKNCNNIPIHAPTIDKLCSVYNPWMWKQNESINTPSNKVLDINFELPNAVKSNISIIDPIEKSEIDAPAQDDSVKKEAITMIVIRRKKMKKHKLKKLRKRMKFVWAKRRQRRELKKEKEFQAGLIQQYTKAEGFSAEQYVEEKIKKYKAALDNSKLHSNVLNKL